MSRAGSACSCYVYVCMYVRFFLMYACMQEHMCAEARMSTAPAHVMCVCMYVYMNARNILVPNKVVTNAPHTNKRTYICMHAHILTTHEDKKKLTLSHSRTFPINRDPGCTTPGFESAPALP
jgi:hypothetical protein